LKKLEVRFIRSPDDFLTVGTIAEDRGRVFFEYTPAFLSTGLSLSPFRLPFEPGLFEHADLDFGPLPGLFDDSLPDGWGLLLMDRHFPSLGRNLSEIGPLDRLSWLGTRTMGALTYHPPADLETSDSNVFDLHELGRHAQRVLAGSAREVLPELVRAGGSPGGARPKVLVGFDPELETVISGEDDLDAGFEHWIVKFAAATDDRDAEPIEYAYSLMAAAAGVDMPRTRLFETAQGDRFFGVRRFDRGGPVTGVPPNRRYHVQTFGNLIQSNFRIPSADYADLLKATSLLTRNHQEVLQAFHRMVFNVLAHNRDDHVKNFAFMLDDETGDWRLTPAYDLLFTHGPGGEHTMTVAGEGRRPGRSHLLRLADRARVSDREATAIIQEVETAVAGWPDHAAQAGVFPAAVEHIATALKQLG